MRFARRRSRLLFRKMLMWTIIIHDIVVLAIVLGTKFKKLLGMWVSVRQLAKLSKHALFLKQIVGKQCSQSGRSSNYCIAGTKKSQSSGRLPSKFQLLTN